LGLFKKIFANPDIYLEVQPESSPHSSPPSLKAAEHLNKDILTTTFLVIQFKKIYYEKEVKKLETNARPPKSSSKCEVFTEVSSLKFKNSYILNCCLHLLLLCFVAMTMTAV
jgi:hypothetical protein